MPLFVYKLQHSDRWFLKIKTGENFSQSLMIGQEKAGVNKLLKFGTLITEFHENFKMAFLCKRSWTHQTMRQIAGHTKR